MLLSVPKGKEENKKKGFDKEARFPFTKSISSSACSAKERGFSHEGNFTLPLTFCFTHTLTPHAEPNVRGPRVRAKLKQRKKPKRKVGGS